MSTPRIAAAAAAGVAVGLVAEQQAYAWSDLRGWLPDLVAGWVLIGVGLILVAIAAHRVPAVLLLVAGFSWFAFDFASGGPVTLRWIAARTAYVHRGALLALALTLPAGVPRTRPAKAGVVLALAAAVVWPLWDVDVTAIAVAVALIATAAEIGRRAAGWRERAAATRGLACVALISGVVVADAIRSLVHAGQDVTDATILAYATVIAASGPILLSGVLVDAPAALAERVVSLERRGTRLRDVLRELLGDPELEIGFGSAHTGFIDDIGRPLAVPDGVEHAPVAVSGRELGVVVHSPGTLDDPPTRTAVLAAVGLAAERASLRAEVDHQIGAVDASRWRLVRAEEEERRRLAARLDRGPGAALAEIERLVGEAIAATALDELAVAVARGADQLARVRPEIDTVVRGLLVHDIAELRRALERLREGLPLAVELQLADVPLAADVASALWFVCSESIANVVKHAAADSVRVSLELVDGLVRLSVVDRGRGGADVAGSGLAGLAERVRLIGGRLVVTSPAGEGTSLVAEIPVGLAG